MHTLKLFNKSVQMNDIKTDCKNDSLLRQKSHKLRQPQSQEENNLKKNYYDKNCFVCCFESALANENASLILLN
jgi:hypothetical protein